jgi:Galactose oxidase, central domain/Tyrosine-protein kinase ephrin type A/B receptor-like
MLFRVDLKTGTVDTLPSQGNYSNDSVFGVLLYYEDSMYLICCRYFVDTVLYRYSLSNYSWEYVTKLIDVSFWDACLIDHYIIFTVDLNLYRQDLIDNTLLSMGVFYDQYDYAMACTQDAIYVFGGSYDNTNLLVKLALNEDKSSFTKLAYPDFNYPSPRTCHSLTQINSYLYLFGGQNEKAYFNDLWVYNTLAESWTSAVTKGNSPSERSSHAAASYGNVLLIWGGEGTSGYLSNMYMYNSLTEIWTQITPSSVSSPSDRKGACMVFEMPFAYIFGGITAYGVSNELWKYDFSYNKYTLVSKYNSSGVSYSNCQLEDNIFYSLCGSAQGGHSFSFYLEYNLSSNIWNSISSSSCYTQGIDIKLGYSLIDFGGRYDNRGSSSYFSFLNNNSYQYLPTSYGPYNLGFAYLGSVLYFLYGGCNTVYGNLDYNRGTVTFGSIDMVQISEYIPLVCSPGYYFFNKTCSPCDAGTYSSGFGNYDCKKCKKGTYNDQIAATSISQCYPCPYGTFSSKPGTGLCLICPSGSVCNTGSENPAPITYENSIASFQPSNYVSLDYTSTFLGFQLSFGLLSIFVIFLFLIFARHKIQVLDFFSSNHTYNLGESITLKKTKIGGIFTLFFISLALVISATIFLDYDLNNIKETKVLQPLPVLQMEVSSFQATLQMFISFNDYGDSCVLNFECSPQISFEFFNFKTIGTFSYSCSLVGRSCVIDLTCFGCEINSQSYAIFYLNERFSYASSISVNLSSTSSILDSISRETSILSATNNQLFIGTTATEFYFTLIPSLFTSSLGSNTISNTGYHILVETPPKPGSQYSIQSIQGVSLLSIQIYLIQSSSGLYTERYLNQSFIIVLSGLLGSITGILGGINFLMRIFEGNLNKYLQNRRRKVDYLELKNKRSILIDSLNTQVHNITDNTLISERNLSSREVVKLG